MLSPYYHVGLVWQSQTPVCGSLQSLDWTGGLVDWSGGLDWWTGLVDWTSGLDWWTGLVDGLVDWTGGLD